MYVLLILLIRRCIGPGPVVFGLSEVRELAAEVESDLRFHPTFEYTHWEDLAKVSLAERISWGRRRRCQSRRNLPS